MKFDNLTVTFGMQEIFKDVSLYIKPNEKIGVVGVNGAGKSTLFKVINKELIPDKGKISIQNNLKVQLLKQEIKDDVFNMDTLVFDYLQSGRPILKLEEEYKKLYASLNSTLNEKEQNEIYKKIDKTLKMLEYYDWYGADTTLLKIIDGMKITSEILDKRLNELSGGQKSKIAFARLLYANPDIILLDEPTNHLDKETKDYVTNYLRNYNGSVFIISHDIEFLNKIVNKILYLDKENKTITFYDGNYDDFIHQKDMHDEELLKHKKEQDKEIEKLRSIVLKYSNSSGNLKKMAQDREKKLNKLLENKIEVSKKSKVTTFKLDREVFENKVPLKVEKLYFKYDDNYIIRNLSFELQKGEKFLIRGVNGVGKTTLLKLVFGILKPCKGVIKLGDKEILGYYAQEHELINEDKTIISNFDDLSLDENEIRSILGRFLFFDDDVFKKVKVLSPGEKSRVALAKLVFSNANFLILDEPTNHLDKETQKVIANVFKEFKGTMLVVSHNEEFIKNLGISRILNLPSGIITYYK